jgi:fibronectin type 3 domain-containing protein
MDLGLLTCTADIDGASVCNPAVVQRVVNAALGQVCVVNHTVTLNWTASTSTVAGYNVYRGTTSGGPYSILNSGPIAGTTYADSTVASGQTYYYVTTAVDGSNDQSAYSNEAQAIVPFP